MPLSGTHCGICPFTIVENVDTIVRDDPDRWDAWREDLSFFFDLCACVLS
jgi:hypothetical protein